MVFVEPSAANSGFAFTQCGHQSTPNIKNLYGPSSKFSRVIFTKGASTKYLNAVTPTNTTTSVVRAIHQ